MIDTILERNRLFLEGEGHRGFGATKYPRLKTAIISCMDARLVHLLPAALGLEDGDVVLIKNAGGRITDPYGETMRAVLVALYELGVEDVMVIGHTDCGAQGISAEMLTRRMVDRGIPQETIDRLEKEQDLDVWLSGFGSNDDDVRATCRMLREHPLVPKGLRVHGFVIDVTTGGLREAVRGRSILRSPVALSSSEAGAGPMPTQVSVPGSTWVLPASVICAVWSPRLLASAIRRSISSLFETLSTTFFCPDAIHASKARLSFFSAHRAHSTEACPTWAAIFPLPMSRSVLTRTTSLYSSFGTENENAMSATMAVLYITCPFSLGGRASRTHRLRRTRSMSPSRLRRRMRRGRGRSRGTGRGWSPCT